MRTLGPIAIAVVILAVVAGSLTAAGVFRKPAPVFLAAADYVPSDVSEHDGWWYWIERAPKSRAKLLRAKQGSREAITDAEQIGGYAAAGDVVVWSARNGKQWSVIRRQAGRAETLWTGTESAGAPALAGDAVLWAIAKPGAVHENVTLPSLGPRTEIMVSKPGSALRSAGRLLESGCDVIGTRGDTAYMVCGRSGGKLQAAGYEVSTASGAARRLFGEGGWCQAVLLPNGDLLWTAPSQDSAMPERISAIRSLSPGKAAVTRADWLPSFGRLFAVGDKAYYAAGIGQAALWPISMNDELPRQAATPLGYDVVAAGQDGVLLARAAGGKNGIRLYTYPLP